MKKLNTLKSLWLMSIAIAALLLSSCKSTPKYTKFASNDALFVALIDCKGFAEKISKETTDKLVAEMKKEMDKSSDITKAQKDDFEAIMKDPSKAGVDLRDPILISMTKDKNNSERVCVAGSVLNKDDLTSMISHNIEGDKQSTLKEDGSYSILTSKDAVMMYDKDAFCFLSKKSFEKDADIINMIKQKFESYGSNSIAATDDWNKLAESNGLVKVLVSGKAVEQLPNNMPGLNKSMDLKMSDLSYIYNLDMANGEISLSTEIIPHSKAWEEIYEKADEFIGNISDKYLPYVDKEGISAFANINGAKLLEAIKSSELFKAIAKEPQTQSYLSRIEPYLASLSGDMALSISGNNGDFGYPNASLYIETSNDKITQDVKSMFGQLVTPNGNGYQVSLSQAFGDTGGSIPSVAFGYEKNTSYALFSKEGKPFAPAAKPMTNDPCGKKFYAYCSIKYIVDLISKFRPIDPSTAASLKKCDFIEWYAETNTKTVLRLVMTDKSVSPLDLLTEMALAQKDNMTMPQNSYNDFSTDTLAVDTIEEFI